MYPFPPMTRLFALSASLLKRLGLPCAVALAAFAVWASLPRHAAWADEPKPIKIASIFAMTGPGAEENSPNFRVVRLAAQLVNETGGLLGRQVEILDFDTKSTPLGARQAALEAVRAGVSAVIGPSWSSQAMAMGQVLQHARIPMLGATTTAPEVTRIGDYIFRVCYTDVQQAEVLARFAREDLKAARAAIATVAGDVYSEGLSAGFAEKFVELGGTVGVQVRYLQDAMTFSEQVDAVRAAAPDIVFVPGYTRDSGLFLKQARGNGLTMPFLGGDGWTGLPNYPHLDPARGDNYFVSHWHPASEREESRAFVRLLRKELGTDAFMRSDTGNANAFDAFGLVADAIRRAGSAEPGAIRNALVKTENYPGVTGPISFGSSRDPRKSIVILRITSTDLHYLKTVTP